MFKWLTMGQKTSTSREITKGIFNSMDHFGTYNRHSYVDCTYERTFKHILFTSRLSGNSSY